MADFLLEIGLEEVPARMIASAEAELGRRVTDLLTRERLLAADATITTYSTPRRLAVLVEGVLAAQADIEEQLTGPSWAVAFKDGAPTKAAEAFAKKAGVDVSALAKVTTPKGEYVGATVTRRGVAAPQVLTADLPKEVLSIYWAKNMYWRAGKPERFVRPVRWLVALLDSQIVPLEIAGITAGNASRGHRVLHGAAPVVIGSPKEYAESLRAAKVIVDVAERRQVIRKALDKVTRTVPGARWREDEALVETVTHLTEWPSAIIGDFEQEYLALPEEVLVTVMRDHQKYFAVEDADKKLAPHFLAVLNTEVDEEGQKIIRSGNTRELRARFKDAQFFWDFDQKVPLADRENTLLSITFHKDLGSYWKKTQATVRVAEDLANLAEKKGIVLDRAALITATRLSKCDLSTELVKEFTELQGIIGGLYARTQHLGERVALAIYDQYTPASIDDRIPASIEGQILGVADRLQTIGAMFSIGLEPTGSKDPYALRRAGNGIVKVLAESQLPVSITELIGWAPDVVNSVENAGAGTKLRSFFRERVEFYLKDVCGFAYDVVNAVLAVDADDVRDAMKRAGDTTAKLGSEEFRAVSTQFKRINNILRQAKELGYMTATAEMFNIADEAVRLQHEAFQRGPVVQTLRRQRKYGEAFTLMAELRPFVDTFFEKVMVLDSNPSIRKANLDLIESVLVNFSGIIDFSEIVTG